MTSKIGNKRFWKKPPLSKGLVTGFTLIEALVAVVVLSLGIVFVFRGLFVCLDSFNYYAHYLHALPIANEKLEELKANLSHFGSSAGQYGTSGEFTERNTPFEWNTSYTLLDQTEKVFLYRVDVTIHWKSGQRMAKLNRSTYTLYERKQE